ncbi:ADP-ribosylation factor-like protein 4A [Calliphora vicina]|uniref:ADP-ribosylation factor-like protein 4A n=1 Tax=Calliphora vicina TaxID=7373 RepID=UPI00325AD316
MGTTMGKNGNFLDALPSQGTLHVVMLGLDSAGKTTALYRLKFDQYLNTVPTIGFNCEKVQGMVGKAKGVQFLVWDVGGQEKLRPLWRSYTRCTDGILFVVDSVDVERMEEAKMELMRTAKCPDNQGVPVLILANKQDLPGAREPKELEKLLGLHELLSPNSLNIRSVLKSCSSSTGNIVASAKATENENEDYGYGEIGIGNTSSAVINSKLSSSSPSNQQNTRVINDIKSKAPSLQNYSSTSLIDSYHYQQQQQLKLNQQHTSQKSLVPHELQTTLVTHQSSPSSLVSTPTSSNMPSSCTITNNTSHYNDNISKLTSSATTSNINNSTTIFQNSNTKTCTNTSSISTQYKGWYIQPACAITGEGLQEGLEALYDMILKRRKIQKIHKKRR